MTSQSTRKSFDRSAARAALSKRVLALAGVATMLAAGFVLDFLSPTLRPAMAATGQRAVRDVEAILASRSPGERLAEIFLTKVKTALGDTSRDEPGRNAADTAKTTTRSRSIPAGDTVSATNGDLGPLVIDDLLVPLDLMGGDAPADQFSPIAALPDSFPTVLLGPGGGGGGSGSGGGAGGGGGGGGGPIAEVPPAVSPSTPAIPAVPAPVPEPSTWLSMIVGLAMTAAALRRRRRAAPLAA